MKLLLFPLTAVLLLFAQPAFSQGASCATAEPFCTGSTYTFPASTDTEAETGPDYDCLGTQPNPAWYYLQIDQSGPINIMLSNSQQFDIDFILWGPFPNLGSICNNLTASNVVDCSFELDEVEFPDIPNAISGEFYMLLITNFDGEPTDIIAEQIGGTGTTNCDIVDPQNCSITSLTAVPGNCDANNNYTLTGTFTYDNNPVSGIVTVAVNNGTQTFTQNFNPPFVDGQTYTYSIPNIPGNGVSTTVAVGFTADQGCFQTTTFTAPSCDPDACSIVSLTATAQPCDETFNYALTGAVTYNNNPGTGSLQVTVSNGSSTQTITFDPPFTDNQPFSFSFPGLPANGATTTVVAAFSDEPSCSRTFIFSAPSCSCEIDAKFFAQQTELDIEEPTVQFVNQSANADTYLWSFGDGAQSTQENPVHTFPQLAATYSVKLVATNSFGCSDSTTRIILVKEPLIYYIPNAFTPDGDEANQYFQPVFTSGFDPFNFDMKIYNRWGEIVFETGDASRGWDGTYNGKIAPEGIYTWKIEFKKPDVDERLMKAGHVLLVR